MIIYLSELFSIKKEKSLMDGEDLQPKYTDCASSWFARRNLNTITFDLMQKTMFKEV